MPFRPKRVAGFSYRGGYQYFVTSCAWNRRPIFLEPSNARGVSAQLPPFFEAYAFEVIAYCWMPDYVHLLLEGISPAADFREAMRQWKQQTAQACRCAPASRGRQWIGRGSALAEADQADLLRGPPLRTTAAHSIDEHRQARQVQVVGDRLDGAGALVRRQRHRGTERGHRRRRTPGPGGGVAPVRGAAHRQPVADQAEREKVGDDVRPG